MKKLRPFLVLLLACWLLAVPALADDEVSGDTGESPPASDSFENANPPSSEETPSEDPAPSETGSSENETPSRTFAPVSGYSQPGKPRGGPTCSMGLSSVSAPMLSSCRQSSFRFQVLATLTCP